MNFLALMTDQKISLDELANLADGTKIDLEVIEAKHDGTYNLVKDEITDFISIQSSSKNKPKSTNFYNSLPNTELIKNIENILKNKNLKEIMMKKSAQHEFDAKMARIKKIKSKTYRKMKRREKLKQELLDESVDDSESDVSKSENSSYSISDNIHEFNPILDFKDNNTSEEVSESSDKEIINEAFEVPGFKGNELDFIEEKNKVAIEDAPQIIEHTLPGWNSWAGEGIELEKNKFNTSIEIKDGIKPKDRQDFSKSHVIINEHIEVNDKYIASRPYGYTGKDFSQKINTPVSLETTSLKIFNRFVKMSNKDENNTPGASINPNEFDPQY